MSSRIRVKLFSLIVLAILALTILPVFVIGLLFPDKPITRHSDNDKYINILGSELRYRIYNKGNAINNTKNKPVVILLHGFRNYDKNAEKLIPGITTHTVINLDTIGYGGSDAPDIFYTLDTHRKYIIAFMDALNIDKAILAGASKGASITAWTAAKSPARFESIVLISPSGFPRSMVKKWPYSWLYRPGIVNSMASIVVHSSIYRALFPESMGAQSIDITSTYNSDFANALNHINIPTLILWSEGDKTALYKYSNEYRTRIKHLTFIQMPDELEHAIYSRAPEKTSNLINNFINKQ